jgi:hypothetical protein
MQNVVQKTGTITGREFTSRTTPTGPTPLDFDEIRRSKEAPVVQGLEIFQPPKVNLN